MITRWSKIVMCAAIALFAGLTAVDNLLDYGANYTFVRHVLAMDTTFHDPAIMGRAITKPWAWHAFYLLIIAGEAATALLFAAGIVMLWRARHAAASSFDRAKSWVLAGGAVGFLVWFFGFMVVGGEWFAMWQSPVWNGQQGAFRFYMALLGVMIFVNQPERDLP